MLLRSRSTRILIASGLVAVLVLSTAPASTGSKATLSDTSTGTWLPTEKIEAWNQQGREPLGNLGSAVAIADGLLLVGASFDPCSQGGALVYGSQAGAWQFQERLAPFDAQEDPPESCRGFGASVALDAQAGIAVVGDPGYDTRTQEDAGAAYIYRQQADGRWVPDRKLAPAIEGDHRGAGHGPGFGGEVTVDGDTIAVGALHARDSRGTVFVYEETGNGWAKTAQLNGANQPKTHFGVVSLDDDTLAVGASDLGGKVFLFDRDEGRWTTSSVLLPPTDDSLPKPDGTTCFGFSVDVDADRVAVGEPCWDTITEIYLGQPHSGRVHVYRETSTGWELRSSVTAADGTQGEDFGKSVGLDDETLVVGAPHAPAFYTHQGIGYVFERSSSGDWQRTSVLRPPDTAPYDEFGFAVDVSEGVIAIGSPTQDRIPPSVPEDTDSSGSAYLFEKTTPNSLIAEHARSR